jgi:hypothetical protein
LSAGLPADHDGSLSTLLNRSRLFFEDLPDTLTARPPTRLGLAPQP